MNYESKKINRCEYIFNNLCELCVYVVIKNIKQTSYSVTVT